MNQFQSNYIKYLIEIGKKFKYIIAFKYSDRVYHKSRKISWAAAAEIQQKTPTH
jgi:hypothetical protein